MSDSIDGWWRWQKAEAARDGYQEGFGGKFDASANPYSLLEDDPMEKELSEIWHAARIQST